MVWLISYLGHQLVRLAYVALITNCQGLLYIVIINSIELVSSSARVTSAKFQPKVSQ